MDEDECPRNPLIYQESRQCGAFSPQQDLFFANGILEPRCVMSLPPSRMKDITQLALPTLSSRDTRKKGENKRYRERKREKGTAGVARSTSCPSFSLHEGHPAIKILMVRFRPRTGQSTNYSATMRSYPDIQMSTCFPICLDSTDKFNRRRIFLASSYYIIKN